MAHSSRKRETSGIVDVNMAPLIDVSLVLVVILLVAMPLAFQSSIAVRNAMASGRKAEARTRWERVEIALVSEDSVLVNRTLVAREALPEVLPAVLATSATRQVIVRCADTVSHGAFVNVLDEAKANGAISIALMGK